METGKEKKAEEKRVGGGKEARRELQASPPPRTHTRNSSTAVSLIVPQKCTRVHSHTQSFSENES